MRPDRRLVTSFCMSAVLLPLPARSAPDLLAAAARLLAQESGLPVRPYMSYDFGAEQDRSARSVVVLERKSEELLLRVRNKLGPGILAFIGFILHDDDPKKTRVEVVVAKGKDQFEILRLARIDGINYGLETAHIIAELTAWDREFGIDIRHAMSDQLHLVFKTLPKDRMAFARRAMKFCPDLRGDYPTPAALAAAIQRERNIILWWD